MKTRSRTFVVLHLFLVLILGPSGLRAAQTAEQAPARGYLGVALKMEEDWATIAVVAPDSPASRAGLSVGDRILKVNGKSTENRSLMDVNSWLAGPAGETVTLTLLRPQEKEAKTFESKLVRAEGRPELRRPQGVVKRNWALPPTREAGEVQWEGNKIKSRVLPYPDFISCFIRLPIAHAASTGKGVKVVVLEPGEEQQAVTLVQNIAPGAQVSPFQCDTNQTDAREVLGTATNGGWQIALVANPAMHRADWLKDVTRELTARGILTVVPGDVSEEAPVIAAIKQAHDLGALVVGRVNRQSMLFQSQEIERERGVKLYNAKIREIGPDLFSTAGMFGEPPVTAAATTIGVAALLLEKEPKLTPEQLRRKLISGARSVWQAASLETGRMDQGINIDPVTTEYKPRDEGSSYRFKVLDAAGALGVDTAFPWFLNMLNCPKAWEITRGEGVLVAVTDQGFHLRHPELAGHVQETNCFGPMTFEAPEMNFHGTDMARILVAVAPGVRLAPLLCSARDYSNRDELAENIARSFRRAAEIKADVISGSWAAYFAANTNLLSAIREVAGSGVVVSWFHFPRAHPGVLRPGFIYGAGWAGEEKLGFADRFLVDPPGFHPVEIEAGLSATAPQAAGLAALLKSANRALTPSQIEKILIQTATPIGNGVLVPDAARAVSAAADKKS